MSAIANLLLSVSQSIAAARGRHLRVTVDGHRLRFGYAQNDDGAGQIPDNHYENGSIYHTDFAEPIVFTKDDAENLNMTHRDQVKHFFEQRIFREATNTQAQDFDLHAKLLVGVIVAILVLTVVIVGVLA